MHEVKTMVGMALLWFSLAALSYVPGASDSYRAILVAGTGFLAFAAGVGLLIDGLKKSLVRHLRENHGGKAQT